MSHHVSHESFVFTSSTVRLFEGMYRTKASFSHLPSSFFEGRGRRTKASFSYLPLSLFMERCLAR